jgi:hypothetical protein
MGQVNTTIVCIHIIHNIKLDSKAFLRDLAIYGEIDVEKRRVKINIEHRKIEFHFLDLISDIQIECTSKRITYFFPVYTLLAIVPPRSENNSKTHDVRR